MNIKKRFLIICGCLLFTAMDCTKDGPNAHHRIKFYNDADYAIYHGEDFNYPDTSLLHVQDVTIPGWNLKVEPHHRSHNDALMQWDPYEILFGNDFDTLMVFVFNADSLTFYGWDYAKNNNLVLQRYDLSLSNLQQLNWSLHFPPTEEMRDIKMWPPYGTYDSTGHRIN